ncbi:hypothetical protein [Sorangium sp. So ce204]|uniref:hypothetical protein n=1 Tax=Sorangium sp. So ce204 TaxID=3133288 RepID=UPI003F64555E
MNRIDQISACSTDGPVAGLGVGAKDVSKGHTLLNGALPAPSPYTCVTAKPMVSRGKFGMASLVCGSDGGAAPPSASASIAPSASSPAPVPPPAASGGYAGCTTAAMSDTKLGLLGIGPVSMS